MVEFCDLLGTAYAPVSKIPSVKIGFPKKKSWPIRYTSIAMI